MAISPPPPIIICSQVFTYRRRFHIRAFQIFDLLKRSTGLGDINSKRPSILNLHMCKEWVHFLRNRIFKWKKNCCITLQRDTVEFTLAYG
jgi:hypothetical protein